MARSPRRPPRESSRLHSAGVACPRCGGVVEQGPDRLGRLRCLRCQHLWSVQARTQVKKGTDEIHRQPVNQPLQITGQPPLAVQPSVAPVDIRQTLIGKELGGCIIERYLDRGATGAVFLGRQPSLDRRVAIKVLSPELSHNRELIDHLVTEARVLARINHPNILQVHDLGSSERLRVFYLVLEWIDGCDLDVLIERSVARRLPATTVLSVLRQAAEGLAAAHHAGVIHRDIKPKNLMIGRDHVCKVTDFGLAMALDGARTPSGEIRVGTAAFMSPEQSMQARVDGRSDMYSLGCTAYMALTGHPPFAGDSPYAMILQHRTAPVPSLTNHLEEVDPFLDDLLMRLMAKRPQDRFPTMDQVYRHVGLVIQRLREAGTTGGPTATDSWLLD